MASLGKMIFQGSSGTAYRFRVFPLGTRFRKISGIYVIGNRQRSTRGHHVLPLYVGRTEDFSQPLDRHPKAEDFTAQGADCICVQSDGVEQSRIAKEQDLIAALHPACND